MCGLYLDLSSLPPIREYRYHAGYHAEYYNKQYYYPGGRQHLQCDPRRPYGDHKYKYRLVTFFPYFLFRAEKPELQATRPMPSCLPGARDRDRQFMVRNPDNIIISYLQFAMQEEASPLETGHPFPHSPEDFRPQIASLHTHPTSPSNLHERIPIGTTRTDADTTLTKKNILMNVYNRIKTWVNRLVGGLRVGGDGL